MTTGTLTSGNIRLSTAHGRIRRVVNGNGTTPGKRVPFAPRTGRILRFSLHRTLRLNRDCVNARRVLLNLVHRNRNINARILVGVSISLNRLHDTAVSVVHNGSNANANSNGNSLTGTNNIASGRGGSNSTVLSRFNHGLATRTTRNGLSPIVNHAGRVRHIVIILSHHAGGGPILVNRPNINGATIIRNLTRGVRTNSIPRALGNGRICSLSLNSVITNSHCHNSFRRHLGGILGRVGAHNSVILFVSRVRAVINTNSTSNTLNTSSVLGPVLTHNRLRAVNTAAASRCHGCVRGSTTLRHHFRPVRIRRPAVTRAVRVLGNLHSHCRGRRRIAVASNTLRSTTRLSDQCVRSHGLPSGTVSLVSRTNTHLHVGHLATPPRLGRLSRGVTGVTTSGSRTVGNRSFRGTTRLHSGRRGLRTSHGRGRSS